MKLRCILCGNEHPATIIYACPACGGIPAADLEREPDLTPQPSPPGTWRYRGAPPPVDDNDIVSLGEGNTPIIRSNL